MFGDRFQLRQTVGKLLNVIDETDKVERFQEGVFKTYVAGGMHYFDVKGKAGFEARPTARILIIANERPPISDRSEGIWARMLMLNFKRSFKDKENIKLPRILRGELAGIFNWALVGLERLRDQDAFTLPALSASEVRQYKRDANPARNWLLDNYEPWTWGGPSAPGQ
jgi:putative DNA primase/helicase